MAKIFRETKADTGEKETDRARRSSATNEQMLARAELELARKKTKARKLDTRRKVILGGGLIALARNGDEDAQRLMKKIIEHHQNEESGVRPSPFSDWHYEER